MFDSMTDETCDVNDATPVEAVDSNDTIPDHGLQADGVSGWLDDGSGGGGDVGSAGDGSFDVSDDWDVAFKLSGRFGGTCLVLVLVVIVGFGL